MLRIRISLLKRIVKALCNSQTHKWIETGARACPYSECQCSQSVFECALCDHVDMGEVGGKSWDSCKGCDLRPKELTQ